MQVYNFLEASATSMTQEDQDCSSATFFTQANALLRKSLVFQKRQWKTNLLLVTFPGFLCLLLLALQFIIDAENDKPENKCGCVCLNPVNGSSSCHKVCGIQYSTDEQAVTCAVTSPPETIPAMLQVPKPENRAVDHQGRFPGFPNPSCRHSESCPLVILYTGGNRSTADALMNNLLTTNPPSDANNSLSTFVPGTDAELPKSYYLEPALPNKFTLLSRSCSDFSYSTKLGIPCSSTVMLWRNGTQQIEREIYNGFKKGRREAFVNEIPLAYNFHDTSLRNLEVVIFHNSSSRAPVVRVARSMNLVAQAFLKTLAGYSVELPLSFMKEMPKPESKRLVNFSLLLGPMFFMWVLQLLLPVILISLVYEKEGNLRKMMRMHGLSDGPYWSINYAYHLGFSVVYVALFMFVGSVIGLDFFTKNSYTIQFTFYFVFMNLQIALAFLGTTLFSRTMTATVCGYLYVFGFGLLGGFLFHSYIEDSFIDRKVVNALELFPGFSLYRGLYEFSQYALVAINQGTKGMQWHNLQDSDNGLPQVLCVMTVEWLVFLCLSLCFDQSSGSGCGRRKRLENFLMSPKTAKVSVDGEVYHSKPDVAQEKKVVEGLRSKLDPKYAIVCDELKKTYPGRDGNSDKHAVRGLSLAIRRGECFGMLGPNGAGKTTSINMMIGFTSMSSGKAMVAGLELSKNLDKIYTIMGVCPQHDLLWGTLSGREHLLFYGRLKNMKGSALESAVETSLKNVNLLNGGVSDRPAGTYSGGMKRRLSVAISLLGDTKAVYMDEPSTGLDPTSRRTLWNAILRAKQNRAIILTTHSMEEAEALCDRVGIFVKGQLQCIGNCKELKSQYGGSYIFTVTGDPSKEEDVADLVSGWSRTVKRVYRISGTQKFEISKEIKLARVFREVETCKSQLGIRAWGLTDTTLEDVFIKVARS